MGVTLTTGTVTLKKGGNKHVQDPCDSYKMGGH